VSFRRRLAEATEEAIRRLAELPHQAAGSNVTRPLARWDCDRGGHVVSFTDPICRLCGVDTSGTGFDADRLRADWDMLAQAYATIQPVRPVALGEYGYATSQPAGPEPSDPVAWLERDLDDLTADQDAASIKARLAAVEDTLAEAAEWEQGWTNHAERSADGFSGALDADLGRASPEPDADHHRHVHWGGRVFVGPADGSSDPQPIGLLVSEVRFPIDGVTEVCCNRCGADVERVQMIRDQPDDHGFRTGPEWSWVAAQSRLIATVYPCGHTAGLNWRESDAASPDP
jgi:hypothetical protein